MRKLKEALDNSAFTLSDFQVAFPDQGKVYAAATFMPMPQYTFKVIPDGTDVLTEETPGESYWTQKVDCYSMGAAIDRISMWTKNIRADIRASTPAIDEFEKFREELNAKIADHEKDLEGRFTREEAAAMAAQLDELIQRFEVLRKKNEITDTELNEIKRELSALKENAETFQKKAFFRTAGNKIFNLCRRVGSSKAAKALGLEAAKEVVKLGVEGKLQLPPIS
jgi:hypothetical protein